MPTYAVETDDNVEHYRTKREALDAVKAFTRANPGAWVQWAKSDSDAALPPERLPTCRFCGEAPTIKVDEMTKAEVAEVEARVAKRRADKKVERSGRR